MSNHSITGGCRCGKVTLEVNLASELGTYNPRACNCSFCRKHDAAYISDSNGSVVIRTDTISNLEITRQGDELAEFLFCRACGQLLGARWQEVGGQYGCVNAQALLDRKLFGEQLSVTPKKLSAEQKTARWKELWFPAFKIITINA